MSQYYLCFKSYIWADTEQLHKVAHLVLGLLVVYLMLFLKGRVTVIQSQVPCPQNFKLSGFHCHKCS